MPAKNKVKEFQADSYYHIYNRGVEKRTIFQDAQDYSVFLSYLKNYLLPKDETRLNSILADPQANWRFKDEAIKLLRMNNFSESLNLLCYCLMPNHFHLLIKQTQPTVIYQFMQSLGTRYTMFFNKKYKRVGSLFQDVYKAVRITYDEQLLYVTRYIHKNSLNIKIQNTLASQGPTLQSYSYSSYQEYLGLRKTEWVKPQDVLVYFQKSGFNSYEEFIDEFENEYSVNLIKDVTIDLK